METIWSDFRHWQLDFTFQKDLQKIRIGIVLKDLALVRKLSLQLINKISNRDSIKVVCN